MDYPAPRIGLVDGAPDLSDAYGSGLGAWDMAAIKWLYGPPGSVPPPELRYVADENARTPGTAQPWGSMWDDGADPAAELTRVMAVRDAALARFGPQALNPGEPAAMLRRKFVPIWLLHRYQVEAAGKLLGGVESVYAVAGDGRTEARPVDGATQQRALDALMATLAPRALDVPERLIPALSAGWSGESDRQFDIEIMRTAGGTVFDPLVAADVAAQVTLDSLLAPARLARLADQHRRDPSVPGPREVAKRLIAAATTPAGDARLAAVRRAAGTRSLLSLAKAARDAETGPEAAARLDQALTDWATAQGKARYGDPADRDWALSMARLLQDREALAEALDDESEPKVPPGMPIGSE